MSGTKRPASAAQILFGAAFFGLLIIGAMGAIVTALKPMPHGSPGDRTRQACAEQYPYDKEAAQRCEITLDAQYLQQQDDDRMKAAKSRSGM